MFTRRLWLALPLVVSCATARPTASPATPRGEIELVESWPLETTLDHPDLRDAKDVWPEMISKATRTLDVAQFYVSNAPSGGKLEPVLQAIEAAADRGVHVRFLAEQKFVKTYPESLDRLEKRKNIEVRRYDVQKLMGEILHAKYFVVDREVGYLGSQNFDWRSLEHIQELGLRIREPAIVGALEDVFDTDWQLAGGAVPTTRTSTVAAARFPVPVSFGEATVQATFVATPRDWLPDEKLWSLPRLVKLIDGAKRSVRVQTLNYAWEHRDEQFPELDDALRRAVSRGVDVRVIVSSWTHLEKPEGQKRASGAPPLPIRVMTIPEASTGKIDFGRVVHAKYLAVDGREAWVGTSNWERDYFFKSRNVGLIVDGAAFAQRLEQFFDDNWNGPYVKPLAVQMPASP